MTGRRYLDLDLDLDLDLVLEHEGDGRYQALVAGSPVVSARSVRFELPCDLRCGSPTSTIATVTRTLAGRRLAERTGSGRWPLFAGPRS